MYVRYSDSASGLSIDAKVWGPGAFGGSGMMTLYAGLGLSEAGDRAWRSGVRRTLGSDITFGWKARAASPSTMTRRSTAFSSGRCSVGSHGGQGGPWRRIRAHVMYSRLILDANVV